MSSAVNSSTITPSYSASGANSFSYAPFSGTLSNTIANSYPPSISYSEPKFTINQDSYGTWQVTINTKNKKFIRGILQTLLNDCSELELEESIEITKQINKVI